MRAAEVLRSGPGILRRNFLRTRRNLDYLRGAAGSAIFSWTLVVGLSFAVPLCVVGIGIPLLSKVVRAARTSSARDLERSRRLTGGGGPGATTERADALRRRAAPASQDIGWTAVNATAGLLAGAVVFVPVVAVVSCLTVPLWWWALPDPMVPNPALYPVDSWPVALVTPLAAVPYLALLAFLAPRAAAFHARLAERVLAGDGRAALAARLAEVTASRAEALEAHAAELRRIERALHDGTQNRLVAVRLHLGIAERLLEGDPAKARRIVEVAQLASEEALADLRDVVRSIYPPVLSDRGLAGAVTALTARCPVPCTLRVGELERAPAAVEVAAYFAVSEALTNAAKHSGATRVEVSLRTDGRALHATVSDDGRGGAAEEHGSGIAGIRQRVAAFDGTTEVTSPPGGPTTIRVELPCAF
ncbi:MULTISPECIES: sensor histidine kinase [Streptomyces]|uniref:sensor histidine kinase n=1 Tax=Streptomyces TaxID=1883 RepID=UPI0022AA97E3|nr:sensor histidine kinase [Streptomyces sp. HB2AG]MCZ2524759.1 sensor domain-containing protein [Streptomyces sp. HB2AG]